METKTCRSGNISDLSTRSTSRWIFLNFVVVADKSIFKISNSGRTILYFSSFSSIYRPTMETKTRRFGNISDSSMRSTSSQRFFEIHFRCIYFIYFKSVIVEEEYPLWLEGWWFSATKTNFEKPPEGGGVSGLIRNSPESARLCFYCRMRNWGKGREVVKVYTITYFKKNYPQRKWISKNSGGGSTTWTNPK